MQSRYLVAAVLGLVLVGALANTARPIEVTPPSPVPALSPTIITVTYDADKDTPKFYVVLGVVNGHMYVPTNVTLVRPGVLTFSGPPGEYLVTVAEKNGQGQQMVTVEGDDSPDPPVPPVPPEPGKRLITIVRESQGTNPGAELPEIALTAQEVKQYAKTKGHIFRLMDPDQKQPNPLDPRKLEKIPWLVEYLKSARNANVALPFLVVVAPGSGGDDKAVFLPLPKSGAEAIKLIQKYGG